MRDLTEATEGHAAGLGMVDFITKRFVEKIDMQTTTVNALAACCPEEGKIPMNFPTDRQAIAAALMTIRTHTPEDLRIVHIKNTLELTSLAVSEGCLSELAESRKIDVSSESYKMKFDQAGNLIPLH